MRGEGSHGSPRSCWWGEEVGVLMLLPDAGCGGGEAGVLMTVPDALCEGGRRGF